MSIFKAFSFSTRPSNQTLFRSGYQKMTQRDYNGAIAEFDRIIEHRPDYEALNNRASANFKLNNYPAAIRDYSHAIAINPNIPEAYIGLGVVNTQLENYPEAEQNYTHVIRLHPSNFIAYTNRGFARFKQENFEEALHDFNRAIDLNPQNSVAYYNRGSVYFKMGKPRKAFQDWQTSLKLGFHKAEEMLDRHCTRDQGK
ncbi:MAG: tetratricopeptide repeat protein [Microscillaceae bacterium]|nr:tetratricopeptide repeat protein [Microscillaceae bacterium]